MGRGSKEKIANELVKRGSKLEMTSGQKENEPLKQTQIVTPELKNNNSDRQFQPASCCAGENQKKPFRRGGRKLKKGGAKGRTRVGSHAKGGGGGGGSLGQIRKKGRVSDLVTGIQEKSYKKEPSLRGENKDWRDHASDQETNTYYASLSQKTKTVGGKFTRKTENHQKHVAIISDGPPGKNRVEKKWA